MRIFEIAAFLWDAARGYRLRPWASPYLRWRIETYSGIPADRIDRAAFRRFTWRERGRLWSFLRWAGEMRRDAGYGVRTEGSSKT